MDSDLSANQFASTETKHHQHQPDNNNHIHHHVTIGLIILGFYFLAFAIVELITNYQSTTYSFQLSCSTTSCSTDTNFMSFSTGSSVYVYLINSVVSQNDISYSSFTHTVKNNYITNQQVSKTISLTGTALNGSSQAYPNGQFQSYYPEGTFTITNQETNQPVNLNINSLSVWASGIKNKNDLSTQWANVEANRYGNWVQPQISLGLRKLWGFSPSELSGNYSISLSTPNPLTSQFRNRLSVELTDSGSLGGYNLALCIYNFIYALMMFLVGFLSFFFELGDSKQKIGTREFQEQMEINVIGVN